MVREGPPQPAPYPAEKMREDAINARKAPGRMLLIGGLAVVAIVVIALAFWG